MRMFNCTVIEEGRDVALVDTENGIAVETSLVSPFISRIMTNGVLFATVELRTREAAIEHHQDTAFDLHARAEMRLRGTELNQEYMTRSH